MARREVSADHSTLTLDELALAIKNSVDDEKLPEEAARDMAYRVLNFFGHSDRMVDNILEPIDRDPFYMLEDIGILTTEMEEVTIYDGKEWRIHYWLFRNDRIRELIERKAAASGEDGDSGSVYDSLTDDVWQYKKR
ncbi:MAG: hypothetical protein ISF22_11175 [Methanomassiliicoccus sp.]|nr:hypothetical protein [Methanomassiliicoccus sp.]